VTWGYVADELSGLWGGVLRAWKRGRARCHAHCIGVATTFPGVALVGQCSGGLYKLKEGAYRVFSIAFAISLPHVLHLSCYSSLPHALSLLSDVPCDTSQPSCTLPIQRLVMWVDVLAALTLFL
jgi:hypothetical protein